MRNLAAILTAVGLLGATACQRQSLEKQIVGVWQFSGMDNTLDYVFKADHTYEMWGPSMDANDSAGPWLLSDFGTWQVRGDEIIVESQRPASDWLKDAVPETKEESELIETLKQRIDRWKVVRFGADKIEFERGGPLIRATSRRGI